ncbi:MAG: hypothetical protein ABSG18_05500 [Steroidobacteraceae bacterium]|jgi:hypothetical protein
MTAGARTAYRIAQEGHLPRVFGRTNGHRARVPGDRNSDGQHPPMRALHAPCPAASSSGAKSNLQLSPPRHPIALGSRADPIAGWDLRQALRSPFSGERARRARISRLVKPRHRLVDPIEN